MKYLELLGLKARDKITKRAGVITSIDFDLYGCVQAILTGTVNEEGEVKSSNWLDVARLEIIDKTPVMEQPKFKAGYEFPAVHGAANKPLK